MLCTTVFFVLTNPKIMLTIETRCPYKLHPLTQYMLRTTVFFDPTYPKIMLTIETRCSYKLQQRREDVFICFLP